MLLTFGNPELLTAVYHKPSDWIEASEGQVVLIR